MHLFYYDEVKYDPNNQPSFWLGGVCVQDEKIKEIENEVNEISKNMFGTNELNKKTEMHAVDLIGWRGNFKGKQFEERMNCLRQILNVLSRKYVHCVHVKVKGDNQEKAFANMIKKVNNLLAELNTHGIIIGDYDEEYSEMSAENLSQMRQAKNNRIIEAACFSTSHNSRMLQLADVYIYCMQFLNQPSKRSPPSKRRIWRKQVKEIIRKSGIK